MSAPCKCFASVIIFVFGACGSTNVPDARLAVQAPDAAAPTPDAGSPPAIRIGVLTDCDGPFGFFRDATVAGAMVPLLERGALRGAAPGDLVTRAKIAGRPIELFLGCGDDTLGVAETEARRLIDTERVEILIGPLSGDEGVAVAEVARAKPGVTFVNGTAANQRPTLKLSGPNLFRWNPDAVQWSAGLGAYAYHDLGWRSAVVVGQDYSFPYDQAAGFIAEFCSLGGTIAARLWPPIETTDFSSYIAQIPSSGVDGYFIALDGGATVKFVEQNSRLPQALGRAVVTGALPTIDPSALMPLGTRVDGIRAGSPVPPFGSSEAAFVAFQAVFDGHYPEFLGFGGSLFVIGYHNAMEAVALSLEAVNGDLSGGHAAFRAAMKALVLHSPLGDLRLDERRQAIAPTFIHAVLAEDASSPASVVLDKVIPNVDQSFDGLFTPSSPENGATQPACTAGNPPPWAVR